MPWHTPSRGFVRPSTDRISAAAFEKLEDRVAVAATATLAGSGIIFDGMPQLIVRNELPPIARTKTGAVHTDPLGMGQQKNHHKKEKKGGGGGHGRGHAPVHHGHKKQNLNSGGGAKNVGAVSGLAGGGAATVVNKLSSGGALSKTSGAAPSVSGFSSGSVGNIAQAAAGGGVGGGAATSGPLTNVTLDANATWSTSINGGTAGNAGTVTRDAGGFTLREGDSLRTAVSETFSVP